MQQTTLCFLVKNNQILLGLKKRGFGEGKLNGIGGKKEETDSTITETARRELFEEIGVEATQIQQVATVSFYFENREAWNQEVSIFLSTDWKGEPTESEEMKPEWFSQNQIPYDKMWEDDKFWLPSVLQNKTLRANFWFNSKMQISRLEIAFT